MRNTAAGLVEPVRAKRVHNARRHCPVLLANDAVRAVELVDLAGVRGRIEQASLAVLIVVDVAYERAVRAREPMIEFDDRHALVGPRWKDPILARRERIGCRQGDRKSTRLNSSHSQISYAVFCLKKK